MKRIFVAVDSSPRAKLVLAAAVTLAKAMNSKIFLFRSVSIPPEIPVDAYMSSTTDLQGLLLENARKEMDTLAKEVPAELLEKTEIEVAVAWDGICRAAKQFEADLIVIGSHGYGLLDRVLGTTAAKVVNHADRSVLVVRNSM